MDDLEGKRIGPDERYLVKEKGGSKSDRKRVYFGKDAVLDKDVFIKMYTDGDSQTALDRMTHDANVLSAAGKHISPSVVDTFLDRYPTLVEECVHGDNLVSVIENIGELSPYIVLSVGKEIGNYLSITRERGISPTNLTLDNIIVKMLENNQVDYRLTSFSSTEVNPLIAAPEVLDGGKPSETSDVYTLGALMYRMLNPEYPHAENGILDQAARASNPPKKLSWKVDRKLRRLVMKALSADPKKRHQNMAEMVTDIDKVRNRFDNFFMFNFWGKRSKEIDIFGESIFAYYVGETADLKKEIKKYDRKMMRFGILTASIICVAAYFLAGYSVNYGLNKGKRLSDGFLKALDTEKEAILTYEKAIRGENPLENLKKAFDLYVEAEKADPRFINYLTELKILRKRILGKGGVHDMDGIIHKFEKKLKRELNTDDGVTP